MAVLWAVGIGLLTWPGIRSPYIEPHVFIEKEGGTAWQANSSKALEARKLVSAGIYEEIEVEGLSNITYIGRYGDDIGKIMETTAPIMISFHREKLKEKRSENTLRGVSIALLPPLMLLIIGMSIAWAIRGFAR
jgi:hypothetical protein